MLQVSSEFKTAMQNPDKRVKGYIVLEDGTEIRPEGDLQQFTIESAGKLLKTAMSKLNLTLLTKYESLVGTTVDVFYGVYTENEEYEYIQLGKFEVTKAEYIEDQGITRLEGYDNMLKFHKEYTSVTDFPTTLYEFLQAVCSGAGVVLKNETIYNGELSVPEEYYAEIPDFTFRDVLEDICEVSASSARITPDGQLELVQIGDTGEELTYDNLLKYKIGDKWGEVNSVVLAREPQEDNVFLRDEDDINQPTNRNILNLERLEVTYSQGEV